MKFFNKTAKNAKDAQRTPRDKILILSTLRTLRFLCSLGG